MTRPAPRPVPRISVIGTGYLGATHAVCMAVLGYEVVGVDVDPAKVARLSAGELPFFEPGLPELLAKALAGGRLRFTTDFAEAGAFADVHFLCVGTPQAPDSPAADLTYVDAAVSALAPHLRRPALVVGKSTVPVGTARRLTTLLHELAPAGAGAALAWNPEFLREGYAVEDTLRPDRLVFGVADAAAADVLRTVFAPVIAEGVPVVETDLETAELVKTAANSFLATKISFINAMAEVCEAAGADVLQLAEALAHDDRIGGRFLRPGLGFGGGCLPTDIRAFAHRAGEIGAGPALEFLADVDAVNLRRRARVVELVRDLAGGELAGVRVAALGAAFKPDSDDIRDAPALAVAAALHAAGARVVVHDPEALANARRAHPELEYADTAGDAARDADVVVLLTEWNLYREIDPESLGAMVRHRRVVDARHALDAEAYRAAGWTYRAPGRPAV